MQRMQRKFGTFLPRTADDAQVSMLIHDFEAADRMLETLIDASKAWRDSWASTLQHQSTILADYHDLYSPIVDKEGNGDQKYAETPRERLARTQDLKASYVTLKAEMLEELQMVEKRIIHPAKDARISIKAYRKVVKKREDTKLDYERYKSRADKLEASTKRTEREETALAKHNMDLISATAAYEAADAHLKNTLPGITNATYSLLPHLLNAQILVQNTLLGQLYTVLHNYAQDHGFSSPPPEMNVIISNFESDFTALRLEAESGFQMLSTGKAVREPFSSTSGFSNKGNTYTGLGIRNNIKSRTSSKPASPRPLPPAIEQGSTPAEPSPPPVDLSTRPKIPASPGMLSSNSAMVVSTPSPRSDYFALSPSSNQRQYISRQPSNTSLPSPGLSMVAAGKKKPPPPPPAKRIPSQQFEYMTALYDFEGQGEGDLSFREGDRIKVVKKTGSVQDWWEGELRGVKGSFPANYCRMA